METTLRTFSVLVDDEPGVLSQISRLFSRKGFNIESLAVGPTEERGLSRLTLEVLTDDQQTELLCNQLSKMVPVHSVRLLAEEHSIRREMVLCKVRAEERSVRSELIQLANVFRASILDVSSTSMTLAVIGEESKNEALTDLLREFGILEMVRTGMVALERGRYTIQDERKETLEFNLGKMLQIGHLSFISTQNHYKKEKSTMAKMYYEKDCDLNYLNGKKIAVIGYGSQGHAHALNLKDSGCEVCVGLREGSKNWAQAEAAGLTVKTVAEAAKWGDIVMMLINDEVQADVYKKDIAPYLEEGNALAFAHGFNIRYKQIVPPAGVDVFMAAPKGPGHTVRSTYVSGKGVPCLVAVEQNATGRAYEIALAYIAGIGGARAGIMETTFHDETETDLFGEQTVLCGGVVDLMQCGFETLVEAGYAPENAYFECIHEMKLIIDLINKGGVAAMNYSISDTAEFGEYVSGPRVLPHEETKARMRAVLADIQDGTFAGRWIAENKSRGRTFFNSKRDQLAKHPMEQVGEELRRNMIWGGDKDLDTASN